MFPPQYAQPQHDSLCAQGGKRKHLSLLLFDQRNAIEEMYAGTGRMPTHVLSPHRPLPNAPVVRGSAPGSKSISPSAMKTTAHGCSTWSFAQGPRASTAELFLRQRSLPPAFNGLNMPASVAAMQVLYPPARPLSACTPPQLVPTGQDSLTRTASSQAQQRLCSSSSLPQHQAGSLMQQTMAQPTPPSWLMPWQTGDRDAGKRMADSIRKKRTPAGGFANLDLCRAVK